MGTRQLNKYFSGFALWLFLAGATSLLGGQAKPNAKPEVKPGVVSGRVFLITQAGDIKPARMADVKLFYASDPSIPIAEAEKDKNSAADEWFVEISKTLSADYEEGKKVRQALDEAQQESKSADKHERREAAKNLPIAEANLHSRVESECPRKLHVYHSALTETLKWVSANIQEKGWQYISEQADEDGHFSMKVPNPGKYVLIVTGRAGLNDAVWDGGVVIINPGEETTVKLASPAVACLETGD